MFRALALAVLMLPALPVPAAAAAAPARRIISLVPSLTEDLFALGAGPRVVGVSAYSDYPAAARRLPLVAGFASVSTERILALRADLVVGIVSQARLVEDLRRSGVRVLLLRDDSLADVATDLRALGAATGRAPAAAALVARLRARTAALARAVPRRARRPALFVVLTESPLYTVGRGSYIARLIELAGGRNAADTIRLPYGRYSAEALLAAQPDALVVDPAAGLSAALGRAPWNGLRAVRERHVYTLRDAAILERPGPRYNDGLAWLIGVVRQAR